MKENLLISACLMGIPCRYDGKEKKHPRVEELKEKYNLIPVCPEIYGGLPTPRIPSERVGDRVLMKDGTDVTENYKRGAECALKMCILTGTKIALLKERSPSCSKSGVYDGSFSGTLTSGMGVAAELLIKNGVAVYGESEIDELFSIDK